MVRMFFVALDEYFSKEFFGSTHVDQIVDFHPHSQKLAKKLIKTSLEQMAVFLVVFGVRMTILWKKGLQNMLSTHPKPFDHITHG